jgi:sterol 3beta-glucosyltransferase
VPTIIKPFFGDQFFFGSRVEDLGVGICMKRLNVTVFSRALREATRSERMIVKAKALGEQIRKVCSISTCFLSHFFRLSVQRIKLWRMETDDKIIQEDGVSNAIQAIYRDLEYAKTLVRQRSNASATSPGPAAAVSGARLPGANLDDDLVAIEETWTFVGDDTEIDVSSESKDREKCRSM